MGSLAAGLGLGEQQAALGILRVVNANMERAIRAISLERGYDPRAFTLVPFGGAGPVHGCELAQELGIPRVLIPARPGILSALGVAIADVVKDYSRTVMLRGADLDRERLEEEFHGMEGLGAGRTGAGGAARGPDDGLPLPGRSLRRPVLRADRRLPYLAQFAHAGGAGAGNFRRLLSRPPATLRLR